MARKLKYIGYPREYTIVGISAVMQEFFTKNFIKFHGGTFYDAISVIKNGQYFRFQVKGDNDRLAKLFLKRVNQDRINLAKELSIFKKLITGYNKLINLPITEYYSEIIIDFYKYYRLLIKYANAAFETMDFIETLDKRKKNKYKNWVIKIRYSAESIYKSGENEFIPKFLNWLIKKYKLNYSVKLLKNVFFVEMEKYISGKAALPNIAELKKRQKLFLVRQYPVDKYQLLVGKIAQQKIKNLGLFKKEKLYKVEKFSGQIAYKGKVTGKVKLIFRRSDMAKFKNNEIIVSPMTEPGYLPIMKKADAFITDEGGLLCHAAIVARELKKPCIIGTKIATRVLRDGQLVEVDANRGIVKILKK